MRFRRKGKGIISVNGNDKPYTSTSAMKRQFMASIVKFCAYWDQLPVSRYKIMQTTITINSAQYKQQFVQEFTINNETQKKKKKFSGMKMFDHMLLN